LIATSRRMTMCSRGRRRPWRRAKAVQDAVIAQDETESRSRFPGGRLIVGQQAEVDKEADQLLASWHSARSLRLARAGFRVLGEDKVFRQVVVEEQPRLERGTGSRRLSTAAESRPLDGVSPKIPCGRRAGTLDAQVEGGGGPKRRAWPRGGPRGEVEASRVRLSG